jgi:hypothetical protein
MRSGSSLAKFTGSSVVKMSAGISTKSAVWCSAAIGG